MRIRSFYSGAYSGGHGNYLHRPVYNQSEEQQKMVSKYHSQRTSGYDSKKEKRRADELRLLQRAGHISGLQEQVRFELIPSQYEIVNGKKKCIEQACFYIADFTYVENESFIVEDVKSPITRANPVYIIKRKLMLQVHGVKIREK